MLTAANLTDDEADERVRIYERMPPAAQREVDVLALLEDADRMRASFGRFVRGAWPIVEPTRPFESNRASEAIIEHLQAVAEGKIRRLLIACPPGIGKSTLASVLFPAWMWARRPGWRSIFASYASSLAIRDSLRTRRLVAEDWYRLRFAHGWSLRDDQNRNDDFENTESGRRVAVGIDGVLTGTRCNHATVDDSLNAIDATSKAARDRANAWFDTSLPSRFDRWEEATRIVIQQRLHENDLIGHLLTKGGYESLILPSLFELKRRCRTSIWVDDRKAEGEVLAPEIHSAGYLAELKKDMGSYAFAGQYQQAPAPDEGGVFQRSWWKRYKTLPDDLERLTMSVDATFGSKTSTASRVAILVGGKLKRGGPDRYIIDGIAKTMGYGETKRAIREMRERHPEVTKILIEKKANGAALIEELAADISGVVAVEPKGGKESRAAAIQPSVEAGNVWLPEVAGWVEDFIIELATFPNGTHDDYVDSASQLLTDMRETTAAQRLRMLAKR